MSELSPDARDLIAQARRHRSDLLGPSAAQRAQLRERLTPLWAASATLPRASTGLRWKLGSFAILAGLGLLSWFATQSSGGAASAYLQPAAAEHAVASAPDHEAQTQASTPSDLLAGAGPAVNVSKSQLPCASADCQPPAAAAAAPPAAPMPKSKRPELSARELASQTLPLSATVRKSKRPELSASALASQTPPLSATVRKSKLPAPALASQATPLPVTAGESKRSELGATLHNSAATADQPGKDAESDLLALADLDPGVHAKPRTSRRAQRATAPAARPPLRATEDRTPEAPVRTDPDPAPPSIDGELELLGAAQAALQKQRPTRALSLLQEHAFRFPAGAMIEERMAMQALALCALQRRHAAQTVLGNLAARGAPSQLLPRVRSQCGL